VCKQVSHISYLTPGTTARMTCHSTLTQPKVQLKLYEFITPAQSHVAYIQIYSSSSQRRLHSTPPLPHIHFHLFVSHAFPFCLEWSTVPSYGLTQISGTLCKPSFSLPMVRKARAWLCDGHKAHDCKASLSPPCKRWPDCDWWHCGCCSWILGMFVENTPRAMTLNDGRGAFLPVCRFLQRMCLRFLQEQWGQFEAPAL